MNHELILVNPLFILSALAERYRNLLFINGMFPASKSVEEDEREDNPDVHKSGRMSGVALFRLSLCFMC